MPAREFVSSFNDSFVSDWRFGFNLFPRYCQDYFIFCQQLSIHLLPSSPFCHLLCWSSSVPRFLFRLFTISLVINAEVNLKGFYFGSTPAEFDLFVYASFYASFYDIWSRSFYFSYRFESPGCNDLDLRDFWLLYL